MSDAHKNNPLHGITLKIMMTELVENYGWETLSEFVNIRCLWKVWNIFPRNNIVIASLQLLML